ncbi:MAG TPA: RsbRD N-terminal domain-containing protein, partial [Polyangia bacterium]|nr:RsbRD N-terminal domain-containing protein [Polyangia bacterium]
MSATSDHGREDPGAACRTLATALTTRSDELVAHWESIVRERAVARPLSEPALRDNLPKILGRLCDALATGDLASALASDASEQHALDRLSRGFLLGDLVSEYAVLRQCIVDIVAETPGCDVSHVRVVDRVVDAAIETAVSYYADANQRVLSAVDRLSREALGTWSLDELLPRLLTVIMESTVATDTATILLRDGDRLRVRAAVGLVAERDAGFSLAIGEGFAGTIAATREPLMLRDAATDPLVKSEFIRAR